MDWLKFSVFVLLKTFGAENFHFYFKMNAKSFNVNVCGVAELKNYKGIHIFIFYFENNAALEFNRDAAPFRAQLRAADYCYS